MTSVFENIGSSSQCCRDMGVFEWERNVTHFMCGNTLLYLAFYHNVVSVTENFGKYVLSRDHESPFSIHFSTNTVCK